MQTATARQFTDWSEIIPGMNLSDIENPLQIIDMVREGLPGATVGKMAEAYQVSKTLMYELLHISVKTGQRIATKKLDKDISDHLMQMLKVLVYAKSVFEDNAKAVHWLKTPCYALGNQTPIQLLDTTEGVQLVLNTLGRMEYGVFC